MIGTGIDRVAPPARMVHHGVEARPADRPERLAARPKRSEERSGSYATSEHRTYGQWVRRDAVS
jgi:hypothetical protein